MNAQEYSDYRAAREAERKRLHEMRVKRERAVRRVYAAVKAGVLSKPETCSSCGNTGRIEGHHPDYDKPLEVIWLCRDCHMQLHHPARSNAEAAVKAEMRGAA